MAEVKTARLRNKVTGVEVTTSETVAANLSGYEPVKSSKKSSDSSESK